MKASLNLRRGSEDAAHRGNIGVRYSETVRVLGGGYVTMRCIRNVRPQRDLPIIDSAKPLEPHGWLIRVQTPRSSLAV